VAGLAPTSLTASLMPRPDLLAITNLALGKAGSARCTFFDPQDRTTNLSCCKVDNSRSGRL
jgi:hypothetical protein